MNMKYWKEFRVVIKAKVKVSFSNLFSGISFLSYFDFHFIRFLFFV